VLLTRFSRYRTPLAADRAYTSARSERASSCSSNPILPDSNVCPVGLTTNSSTTGPFSSAQQSSTTRPCPPGCTSTWYGPASWKATSRLRGLHLGSGSAMKLCSSRVVHLWLETARSDPQQADGEPPKEQRVHPSRHERLPKLESIPSFRFPHTTEGEHERPE
jgi:hypothetical protein